MAKSFLVDLNLNQNELQNGVIQNLAIAPTSPKKGQVYFDTTTNKFRVYNGSNWTEMGTGGGSVTSVAVKNTSNGGLTVSGSPITSSGEISIGHTNVLASAQTIEGIYPITYDKNGHITAAGTAFDPSSKQNSLSDTQLNAVNSGITSTKVNTYDGDASQISGKQDSLTTAQLNAVNSGITSTKVNAYDGYATTIAGKQNTISDLADIRAGAAAGATALQSETDPVFSASAAAGITSTNISNWNGKQNAISDLEIIRSGAAAGATAVQPDTLNSYAPIASPALTGTPTAPTATAGTNSTQIATTAFVKTAIDNLPEPMVFKGTVGINGTIAWSALPSAGASNEGYTYKVITAHNTAPIAAIGDTIISNGSEWVVIPSGDEPSGTVTSVNLTDGGGLTISGGPITSSGSITVGHTNSITAQNTQAVYPIKIDKNGHISAYGSAIAILKKFSSTITGDGSKTSYTITHNLGSRDVIVQVYDNETYEEVLVDIVRATTNTVTISFAIAPAKNYRVVVIG